jgi:hypothetical protein
MADAASVTITATLLPDEIAKTISGSMSLSPVDANDKWYYKLTACTATSTDLIAGNFTDYTPVDDDTAPTAIAAGDKVNFIFIKNLSAGDGMIVCFDGGAAAHDLVDGVFIGAGESWYGRLPNTTVANLHAISADIGGTGDATVDCIVAALIDDVA